MKIVHRHQFSSSKTSIVCKTMVDDGFFSVVWQTHQLMKCVLQQLVLSRQSFLWKNDKPFLNMWFVVTLSVILFTKQICTCYSIFLNYFICWGAFLHNSCLVAITSFCFNSVDCCWWILKNTLWKQVLVCMATLCPLWTEVYLKDLEFL